MKQTTLAIAATMLTISSCGAIGAETASATPFGAFSGRIGNTRVQVCISSYGSAQYYYLRHRAGIRLELADADADADHSELIKQALAQGEVEFVEASGSFASDRPPTGHWKLHAKGDGWSGEWRDPEDTQRLPIKLTRVPTAADNAQESGECPSAFYAPLRDDLRIAYADATFEGHAYRSMTTTPAIAMTLPADAPAAPAIHAYALGWLKDQAVFGYECSLGNGGGSVALDRTLEPVVWNEQMLVIKDNLPDTYCGGAHGNFEQNFIVWDLTAGTPIDTWSWFEPDTASIQVTESTDGEPIRSAFLQLLHEHHPRNIADDECAEFLDQMTIDPPYPSATALVFPTSFFHAMRACGDDIVLPWSDAAAYLSDAGKAAMKEWVQ